MLVTIHLSVFFFFCVIRQLFIALLFLCLLSCLYIGDSVCKKDIRVKDFMDCFSVTV